MSTYKWNLNVTNMFENIFLNISKSFDFVFIFQKEVLKMASNNSSLNQ